MKKSFTILAIDTSCDDTCVAVTSNDRVLSNVIASQVEFHKPYGGVYPSLAKRKHQEFIEPTINEALRRAGLRWLEIDALAVTVGPGLAPALEVGIAKIKELAKQYRKSIIAVNHMEGHLLSSFALPNFSRKNSGGQAKNLKRKRLLSIVRPKFPILGLLVSGGHTQLVLMKGFGKYRLLGETLDDAAGEAFDKVAKMLGLGYPGGPIISELAKTGRPIYDLPVPMAGSGDLNFSFSGLKTACLYKLQKLGLTGDRPAFAPRATAGKQFYCDFAVSFEKTVVEALIIKLEKAIEQYRPKQVVLGGGVINNLPLRKAARKAAGEYGLKVFQPYHKNLFTDNAAMIGVCAFFQAKRGDFAKDIDSLDRQPNLNF
ncbi:MAG: tRNA (adenosine(37)-N6)-threonylcarbamoyltransferase complex transferase subunit TsaD [bacterium]|nr:tRNA (adenosine(37)-N6)-threonylcarbamoyltransferase complex transferase subunit TsaD [bacterium]